MFFPKLDTDQLVRSTFVARVEHHPTLGSTNDRAKQCAAKESKPLPLLIVADEQTAGRGRGTNRWWTGRGSLALSLLLDAQEPEIARSRSPLVGLAAAVAVVETVTPLAPSRSVGVHWPNDVFVDDRKLAGVLVEVLSDRYYVVGIGVNTNTPMDEAPSELQTTITTLLELTGARHDPTALLVSLLEHLATMLRQLASAPARAAARANGLCLQHGKMLTIQTGGKSVTGRCAGIAPDGALLLETPAGRESFYSGVLR